VRAFNGQGDSPYSNLTHTGIGPASPFTDYSAGFPDPSGLQLNIGTTIVDTRPRLTDGGSNEARTAWTTSKVGILSFSTSIILQDQNVRGSGGSLGYGGIGRSVAVVFNLYSGGNHRSTTLVLTDGNMDMTGAIDMGPSGIALGSNHPLAIHLEYDVSQLTLSETVFDTVSWAVFQQVHGNLNIPQIVGGATAYVGFTGGTGGEASVQDIVSWSGRFLRPHQPVRQFSLSASPPAIVGQPLSVTVTARDVFNIFTADFRSTVQLASSDPRATLPAACTFLAAEDGIHTFRGIILRTAGPPTVSAEDAAMVPIAGSTSISVLASTSNEFLVPDRSEIPTSEPCSEVREKAWDPTLMATARADAEDSLTGECVGRSELLTEQGEFPRGCERWVFTHLG
jgi:hypothetical protein